MKYYYTDIVTRQVRWTRGTFVGWTEETGLLKARYAIFRRKRGDLLIPHYCLWPATRAMIEATA